MEQPTSAKREDVEGAKTRVVELAAGRREPSEGLNLL